LKKVTVILSEFLIGKGVESLLSREMELSVTSILYDGDDGVIDHIERYQPSVVIMDESLLNGSSRNLFNQLLLYPKLRVLVLSVQDNRINIYDRKEILVSQSADLISAIWGNYQSG
jgi:DNA-binding NarL/FixJ family response regulator